MALRARSLMLLSTVALAFGAAAVAHADGDPASDVLYKGRVFLPYQAPVSTAAAGRLADAVRTAASRGLQIKVALVSGPQDLGAVPSLFGTPQRYADFLGSELQFVYRGRLLVVMPAGIGIFDAGASVAEDKRLLRAVPVAAGSDGLAAAAIQAIRALEQPARAAKPAASPRRTTAVARGSAATRAIGAGVVFAQPWRLSQQLAVEIALAAVAALVVAGVVLVRRRREALRRHYGW